MALRCLTRIRTEVIRLTSLPKSFKLQKRPRLTPKPGSFLECVRSKIFNWDMLRERADTYTDDDPPRERAFSPPPPTVTEDQGMDCGNVSFHCEKDENACLKDYVIEEAAKLCVHHLNNEHNTEFELVKVLKAKQFPMLKIMNMYLQLKDGHVPHVYYFTFGEDKSSDGDGLVIHTWRTLDRFEYETCYPYSNTLDSDLDHQKNAQTANICGSTDAVECEKDKNGCFEDDVIEGAQFAVEYYNEKHNTYFVFVKVLKARKCLLSADMDITIMVSDGDRMPHVYYVTVKGEGSADKNGKKLHTWRTLDRLEYETTFPACKEYVRLNSKHTRRCRRCGFPDLDG